MPARIDIHRHVGDESGRLGRCRQVAGIRSGVRRLNERRTPFPQTHGPLDLEGRDIAGRHQDPIDPVLEQDLGLADLRRADPDRATRELQSRDRRALVCLGVRTTRDAVRRHRALHGHQVDFEGVEIDAQGWCVQIPFRDTDLALHRHARRDFTHGVSLHRRRYPGSGYPRRLQKTPTRHGRAVHVSSPFRLTSPHRTHHARSAVRTGWVALPHG